MLGYDQPKDSHVHGADLASCPQRARDKRQQLLLAVSLGHGKPGSQTGRCPGWEGPDLDDHVPVPVPCPARALACGNPRLVAASDGVRDSHDLHTRYSELAISSWFPSSQCGFDSRHALHTRRASQRHRGEEFLYCVKARLRRAAGLRAALARRPRP